ncbi:MAG: S41 family peptidase [Pseudomonadota bacterium]
MPRYLFAALLLIALPTASTAETPRTVAGEIAAAIEANYFDAGRAAAIADAVERQAAAGAYDAMTDPLDLAAALTEALQPHDGHFRVGVPDVSKGDDDKTLSSGTQMSFNERLRRTGWGFAETAILPGNLGLIDMTAFAHFDFGDADSAVRQTADSALALTAAADALIFDLRANGGGSPHMVGYLVSAFTGRDDIYNIFHARDGTSSEAPASPYAAPFDERPVFILTSGRTASAAEAFAYTLQAAGLATVVGETSAGAANPGETFETPSGYSVFVATGSPRNPLTGTNWEGTGVVPDVAAPSSEALEMAQRLALRAVVDKGDGKRDTVWALEALTASLPAIDGLDRYAGRYGDWNVRADADRLLIKRGGRPERTLVPLRDGLFYRADDPAIRYRFHTDGGAPAVELETAYGGRMQRRRS